MGGRGYYATASGDALNLNGDTPISPEKTAGENCRCKLEGAGTTIPVMNFKTEALWLGCAMQLTHRQIERSICPGQVAPSHI